MPIGKNQAFRTSAIAPTSSLSHYRSFAPVVAFGGAPILCPDYPCCPLYFPFQCVLSLRTACSFATQNYLHNSLQFIPVPAVRCTSPFNLHSPSGQPVVLLHKTTSTIPYNLSLAPLSDFPIFLLIFSSMMINLQYEEL